MWLYYIFIEIHTQWFGISHNNCIDTFTHIFTAVFTIDIPLTHGRHLLKHMMAHITYAVLRNNYILVLHVGTAIWWCRRSHSSLNFLNIPTIVIFVAVLSPHEIYTSRHCVIISIWWKWQERSSLKAEVSVAIACHDLVSDQLQCLGIF